jgi:hypothetical protein
MTRSEAMSILGISTILLVLIITYLWKRERSVTPGGIQTLFGVWLFQVGFALLDGFCLGCGREGYHTGLMFVSFMLIFLTVVLVYRLIRRRGWLNMTAAPLIGVLILTLVYVEYFNGVETFDSVAEFREMQAPLKPYYRLLPFKLHKTGWEQADLFNVTVMVRQLMNPMPVKKQDSKLYYYKVPRGRWFEYGVPEHQQL